MPRAPTTSTRCAGSCFRSQPLCGPHVDSRLSPHCLFSLYLLHTRSRTGGTSHLVRIFRPIRSPSRSRSVSELVRSLRWLLEKGCLGDRQVAGSVLWERLPSRSWRPGRQGALGGPCRLSAPAPAFSSPFPSHGPFVPGSQVLCAVRLLVRAAGGQLAGRGRRALRVWRRASLFHVFDFLLYLGFAASPPCCSDTAWLPAAPAALTPLLL